MAKSAATVRRVTASLRERDETNLEKVAERAGLNQNDAIRKALATEAFIQETMKEGGEILVKGKAGIVREVRFVN